MRTKTIKIYTFDELDKKAKEKAREWWRTNTDFYTCDTEMENTIKRIVKCIYNASYDWSIGGQGDYIAITNISEDVLALSSGRAMAWLENNFLSNCNRHQQKYSEKQKKIINRSKLEWKDWKEFCNFTGMAYDCYLDDAYKEWINSIRKGTNDSIEDFFNTLCNTLLKAWQEERKYEDSNGYIDEMLMANEYEFYKDGTKY